MVCDIVYTLRETNNQHATYGCETHRKSTCGLVETIVFVGYSIFAMWGKLKTANMDEKEKRYEFWEKSSVFTPA